jgi:hypothetical protein
MIWIYGGQWTQGLGSYPLYYGDFYANSTQTVVVTFNYRLGAFGFLANNVLQGTYLSGAMEVLPVTIFSCLCAVVVTQDLFSQVTLV